MSSGDAELAAAGRRGADTAIDGPRLALQTFDSDDAEVVLRVTLDEAWADSPIEPRVFAYGTLPFTVASVELRRDRTRRCRRKTAKRGRRTVARDGAP